MSPAEPLPPPKASTTRVTLRCLRCRHEYEMLTRLRTTPYVLGQGQPVIPPEPNCPACGCQQALVVGHSEQPEPTADG